MQEPDHNDKKQIFTFLPVDCYKSFLLASPRKLFSSSVKEAPFFFFHI